MEWGLVNGKFYKWPLHKYWKPVHEDQDDEDLVSHSMHRYFDGDMTTQSNPLLAPFAKSPTQLCSTRKNCPHDNNSCAIREHHY